MEQYLEVKGATLIVKLPGEIDHHNAEEIKDAVDKTLQRRMVRMVVFDFARTVFMDSSGVGMLMGRYKMMRFMGGNVIAVHVNERMRKVLKLSGIYKIIDIYDEMPAGMEVEGNGYAAK